VVRVIIVIVCSTSGMFARGAAVTVPMTTVDDGHPDWLTTTVATLSAAGLLVVVGRLVTHWHSRCRTVIHSQFPFDRNK